MILTAGPTFHEGRLLLSSFIDRSTYETAFYNLRLSVNQLYYQLIVVPRNNDFYIPLILNSLLQLKKSVNMCKYTYIHTHMYFRAYGIFYNTFFLLGNKSHVVAGSVGILIGSYCTILVKNYILPHTRYLTLMKAVVAKNERGPQVISAWKPIYSFIHLHF